VDIIGEDMKDELDQCKASYLEVVTDNSYLVAECEKLKLEKQTSKVTMKKLNVEQENFKKATSNLICKDILMEEFVCKLCSTTAEVLKMTGNTEKVEAEFIGLEMKYKDLVEERDELQGKLEIASQELEAMKSRVVAETETDEMSKKSVDNLQNQIVFLKKVLNEADVEKHKLHEKLEYHKETIAEFKEHISK
jgi:chromosome segregation ATPase